MFLENLIIFIRKIIIIKVFDKFVFQPHAWTEPYACILYIEVCFSLAANFGKQTCKLHIQMFLNTHFALKHSILYHNHTQCYYRYIYIIKYTLFVIRIYTYTCENLPISYEYYFSCSVYCVGYNENVPLYLMRTNFKEEIIIIICVPYIFY